MEEELGLRIDDLRPSGELQARIWHGRNTLHLFRAEVQTQALKLDLGELETARWFRRGELPPDLGAYVPPILATVT